MPIAYHLHTICIPASIPDPYLKNMPITYPFRTNLVPRCFQLSIPPLYLLRTISIPAFPYLYHTCFFVPLKIKTLIPLPYLFHTYTLKSTIPGTSGGPKKPRSRGGYAKGMEKFFHTFSIPGTYLLGTRYAAVTFGVCRRYVRGMKTYPFHTLSIP